MFTPLLTLPVAASLIRGVHGSPYPTLQPSPADEFLIRRNEPAGVETSVSAAIDAIGGVEALSKLRGITYHAPNIYRSQTLTQNYNLAHSDQTVSTSGAQNMSFDLSGPHLRARVDRAYGYDAYWIWAFPDLKPSIDFTYVLEDGPQSYACFTKGQNSFFSSDPSQALGYADNFLTDYLIHHARTFAIPWLLLQLHASNDTGSRRASNVLVDPETNTTVPGIEDSILGVTLVLNQTSNLPYLIRSQEQHAIFGPSTNDLVLSDYRAVTGLSGTNSTLLLPHRFQTIYNSKDVLEDFQVESITLDPVFGPDFFTPLPAAASGGTGEAPSAGGGQFFSETYTRAEVHDFFEAGLWSGPFRFTVDDVVATHPIPDVPQIQAVYVGYPDYVQLVVELEQGVLVTDAPPHRSNVVIDWVRKTTGKNVTFVVPSHHHHDHAYGVADYVVAGATLVVPDVAADFYSHVNAGKAFPVVTYNASHPFVTGDANVYFQSFYHQEPPHARDWTYALATRACRSPDAAAAAVLFNADVWSPGPDVGLRWDMNSARQWLDMLVGDGVPVDNTVVVGAHGSTDDGNSTTDLLSHLVEMTAFVYPDVHADAFRAGGRLC